MPPADHRKLPWTDGCRNPSELGKRRLVQSRVTVTVGVPGEALGHCSLSFGFSILDFDPFAIAIAIATNLCRSIDPLGNFHFLLGEGGLCVRRTGHPPSLITSEIPPLFPFRASALLAHLHLHLRLHFASAAAGSGAVSFLGPHTRPSPTANTPPPSSRSLSPRRNFSPELSHIP
ncbi:hypothetical protein NL676_024516 [Syzygium grande]|nr:hypothetical protein NL676_024516 [Syzygium grande]